MAGGKIFLESRDVKGVPGRSRHLYLVYREFGKNGEITKEEFVGGHAPDDFGVGGHIIIEAGVPTDDSRDKHPEDKTGKRDRSGRPSQELDLGGKDAAAIWAGMKAKAAEIGKAKIDYDLIPRFQTSNSVINAVMKKAGIPILDKYLGGHSRSDFPGINNDLSDPYDLWDKTEKISERRAGAPIGGVYGDHSNGPGKIVDEHKRSARRASTPDGLLPSDTLFDPEKHAWSDEERSIISEFGEENGIDALGRAQNGLPQPLNDGRSFADDFQKQHFAQPDSRIDDDEGGYGNWFGQDTNKADSPPSPIDQGGDLKTRSATI